MTLTLIYAAIIVGLCLMGKIPSSLKLRGVMDSLNQCLEGILLQYWKLIMIFSCTEVELHHTISFPQPY